MIARAAPIRPSWCAAWESNLEPRVVPYHLTTTTLCVAASVSVEIRIM